MRIKPTDGAEVTRLPSWRPPQVAQLTAEAKQVVTVVVSEQMRALTATLTRSLSDIASLRLQDVLTQDDRLLIAWATELAKTDGVDMNEVAELTSDLARYRAQELVGTRPDLSVENARKAVDTVVLSLPRFAPREEAQARAILFGVATTQSTLDSGFVRALLDPDVQREGGVSLAFVQRMVAALPPGKSDALGNLDVVFARRDARTSLVSAIDRLALPAAHVVAPTPERVELGDVILRERARLVTPRSAYQLLTTTTRNDRALLGLLYVSQEARGGDLRQVDEIARALVALRSGGQVRTSQPAANEAPRMPIHLAAKAAVAYRSVAPPRMSSMPPAAMPLTPALSLRPEAGPPAIAFNLAAALGLSALVAEAHTQALRARRRRLGIRHRGEVEEVAEVQDAQADTYAEAEEDPSRASRRHARWRRALRRR